MSGRERVEARESGSPAWSSHCAPAFPSPSACVQSVSSASRCQSTTRPSLRRRRRRRARCLPSSGCGSHRNSQSHSRPHAPHFDSDWHTMGLGGSSAKQRKTRKFAQTKRMLNPNDQRLHVHSSRHRLDSHANPGLTRTGKPTRRSSKRRNRTRRTARSTACASSTSSSTRREKWRRDSPSHTPGPP